MRVQVEEAVSLVPEEVVRGRGPPTGDADALRQLQRGLQRGVVDGRDAVDAEPDAEENESGLEGAAAVRGGLQQAVAVDVAVVWADVDAEAGAGVALGERSRGGVSGGLGWRV